MATTPEAEEFAAQYDFSFDAYQTSSIAALEKGESVLVSAPTGSGKTVVGEFAVWLAMNEGTKAFYTTPLKALSNQKYIDFTRTHGAENVGLLTGDTAVNPTAPVVVMTTEVLRNMIYERSPLLDELRYVILDEVHYLQDKYRGAVWEEVIIHLPLDVKIVSLSATVSNVEDFSEWIQTLRGPTKTAVETTRPVELEAHCMIEGRLFPLFAAQDDGGEKRANPEALRAASGRGRRTRRRHGGQQRNRGGRPQRRSFTPRPDVVEILAKEGKLPAIYFIFSRKGCNAAVGACLRQGLTMTTPLERSRIRAYAEERCSYLATEDLGVLGYEEWFEALGRGISAHHAGLIPVFKQTVEELFRMGLVKAVFATETLSLGINMPARSVVIESMMKFSGERHEVLTPGEFTQLTGRAGRRGIDTVGHAIVLEQRQVDLRRVAEIASLPSYPLISSFQPSYNMATNLVRNYSREEADHLLNSSFAQYRADRDVVVWERRIERNEAYAASYRQKMHCDKGDFAEYWEHKEQSQKLDRTESAWLANRASKRTREALSTASPGEIFLLPGGRAGGAVVIVGRERSKKGEPRLVALTPSKKLLRLTPRDFSAPPKAVARIKSGAFEPSSRPSQELKNRLAAELTALDLEGRVIDEDEETEGEAGAARLRFQRHPCHACPDRDRHARWAERASRMEREIERLEKQIRTKTRTLSQKFDVILEVLGDHGYVSGFDLTEKGALLARIYNENDLLVAEALSKGWLRDLEVAELAAVTSTFVFESRGREEVAGRLPTKKTQKVGRQIERLARQIIDREESVGIDQTRGTESGFAKILFDWCRGAPLDDVIADDASAGDFIRGSKQTIDLLQQMSDAVDDSDLASKLRKAAQGINRGVVAYTGLE